jgi:hypothetical protein
MLPASVHQRYVYSHEREEDRQHDKADHERGMNSRKSSGHMKILAWMVRSVKAKTHHVSKTHHGGTEARRKAKKVGLLPAAGIFTACAHGANGEHGIGQGDARPALTQPQLQAHILP